MKRFALLMLGLMILITGCRSQTPAEESRGNTIESKEIAQQFTLPMPESMPGDFDFKVSFGYGETQKNEINTYEGTVTKDLIAKGTAAANITFDEQEKRQIYDKMKEMDIMNIQDLVPSNPNCSKVPYNEDEWRITVNGNIKMMSWSDKNCEISNDANQLLELRNEIFEMVQGKEAYQTLPAAEGGYD
ncbi:hypothetical protein [Paenibacillus dakarensis]|uniref:hypothetical protein n=1 Tax=Paenibacillus dakarensis TaxID=1527293 RepID=UPI0006D559E9|nr:hypothetical protein [Paenibacillus dakarensis]